MQQATGPQAQAAHDDKLTLPGDQIKALFDQYGGKQDTIAKLAQQLQLSPEELAKLKTGAPLALTPAQYQGALRAMSAHYARTAESSKDGASGASASNADGVCGSSSAPTPAPAPAGHIPADTSTSRTDITEATPGTTQHTGTVGTGSSQGTVTLRTGVDTTSAYHSMFAISYRGPDSANAHWLQFIWREIIGVHADGSSHPVAATIRTTAANTYDLCTNGSATASGAPAVANYNTDSASGTDPLYDAGFTADRTADSTTMYDQPAAQATYVQAAFRNGATRVVSRAHFNTFLIQNDHVTYRVQTNVAWDIASAAAAATAGGGTATAGSSGAATALPADIRTRFHAQYPTYAFIT
jgi:hypothetical protein